MSSDKCIYISGPMRGIPEYNFPAFYRGEALWLMKGWEVLNPARIDEEEDGFDPKKPETIHPDGMRHYLVRDVKMLAAATAIAMLPGWEKSKGAKLELCVAYAMGLDVFDIIGNPLPVTDVVLREAIKEVTS